MPAFSISWRSTRIEYKIRYTYQKSGITLSGLPVAAIHPLEGVIWRPLRPLFEGLQSCRARCPRHWQTKRHPHDLQRKPSESLSSQGVPIYIPIRRSGTAVTPAIKETTGFGLARVMLYCLRNSAASCSAVPPISPIMTMAAARCYTMPKTLNAGFPFSFTFCLIILQKNLECVDKVSAVDRIAADTDAQGLANATLAELVDGFVRECA